MEISGSSPTPPPSNPYENIKPKIYTSSDQADISSDVSAASAGMNGANPPGEKEVVSSLSHIQATLYKVQNHANELDSQDFADLGMNVMVLNNSLNNEALSDTTKSNIANLFAVLGQTSIQTSAGSIPLSHALSQGLVYHDAQYALDKNKGKDGNYSDNVIATLNAQVDAVGALHTPEGSFGNNPVPNDATSFIGELLGGYTDAMGDNLGRTRSFGLNFHHKDPLTEAQDHLGDDPGISTIHYDVHQGHDRGAQYWRKDCKNTIIDNFKNKELMRMTYGRGGSDARGLVNPRYVMQNLFPKDDKNLQFDSTDRIGGDINNLYSQNTHHALNKHVASMQIDSGNAMDIETASNHVMTSLAENEMWH
jgi:hypothetical protein